MNHYSPTIHPVWHTAAKQFGRILLHVAVCETEHAWEREFKNRSVTPECNGLEAD